MARYLARPYGSTISGTRFVSLLMALVLLWALYDRFRDPATWRWLVPPDAGAAMAAAPDAAIPAPEVVIPGPNDLDAAEQDEFRTQMELVTDRTPLRSREMLAYWQLMKWSRTQSLHDLERRAQPEPPFIQLWEEPARYRSQPIRLRMHVRRVHHWTDSDNPLGLKDVYEAWGWTEGSKSQPYVIVFPERPAALPVGDEIRGEIVFVGYMLKIMAYKTMDGKSQAAPLLIGRARTTTSPMSTKPPPESPLTSVIAVVLGTALLAGGIGWWLLGRSGVQPRTTATPSDEMTFDPVAVTLVAEKSPLPVFADLELFPTVPETPVAAPSNETTEAEPSAASTVSANSP